jgi:hypothetical protein
VRGLRLPAELSDRLRERSRREGTTVHGALAAALVFAGRDIHRDGEKRRFVLSHPSITGRFWAEATIAPCRSSFP